MSTRPRRVTAHGGVGSRRIRRFVELEWGHRILQSAGVRVTAAPNPLRGLVKDSAYVGHSSSRLSGPVLAVGHSYGGAVISNAAGQVDNVVGLVFVAAFAPDEGERLGEVTAGSKDSILSTALVPLQYPDGPGVRRSSLSVQSRTFAADLSPEQAAVVAAIQRPIAELAFSDPSGTPAWKTLRLRHDPSTTRQQEPTSSAPWQSAQGPPSPRSRVRT